MGSGSWQGGAVCLPKHNVCNVNNKDYYVHILSFSMRRQAQYPKNRDTGTDPFLYLPFSKRARLVVRRRIFIMEACAQYRFSVDLNGLDSVITFYDVPVKEV